MTLPDNRVRFPSGLIDFVNDVGVASQDHDNYPPPQGQARYDHMRMVVIGLLAQQASFDEPTQYRNGTPWFDLNVNMLKIRSDGGWVNYSDVIPLGEVDTDGNYLTLTEWFDITNAALSSIAQEIVFNGTSASDGVTNINIPESLQAFIFNDTRCFFYLNGLLIDPRNCTILSGTTIKLEDISLSTNDEFTLYTDCECFMSLVERLNKALERNSLRPMVRKSAPKAKSPRIEPPQEEPLESVSNISVESETAYKTLAEGLKSAHKHTPDEFGTTIIIVEDIGDKIQLPTKAGKHIVDDIQKKTDGRYEVHLVNN